MHLAAALVAIGLIVGLYVRGIALRYEAGWESTFLGPGSAYALISALYEPASALSGISHGSPGEISELRWTGHGRRGRGGNVDSFDRHYSRAVYRVASVAGGHRCFVWIVEAFATAASAGLSSRSRRERW